MYDAIVRIIQKQFPASHNNNAKPSSQAVATWRAVHQLLEHPVIFNDPFALRILGNAASGVEAQLESHKDPLSSAMRMAIAVRSRFAEDERKDAAAFGIHQYVVLGAGLDTYAYRSNHPGEHVFEVDLPTTQSMKVARLQQQAIQPTCSVHYVACDFEEGTLEKGLALAGFDKSQKAFFSCLGVVNYLDFDAFEQTLQFIASCAPGSILIFDYIIDPNNLSEMECMVLDIMSAHLAAGGEPFKCFLSPQLLSQTLSRLGFSQVKDISPEYLNNRYLTARSDGLRVGNVTRMYIAIV